jgi:hypothetical protein
MSTTKNVSKKVAKKSAVKKKSSQASKAKISTLKIGDFTRDLIMKGGKTSEQIIEEVKKQFPKSAVSPKHISWYLWDMKRKEIKHPPLVKK